MIKPNSKYYWWCQVGSWCLLGMQMLFFAHVFEQSVSAIHVGRIFTVIAAGIISTQLLRSFIIKMNWLPMPIEKILPRLIVAVAVTMFIFVLFQISILQTLHLYEYNRLNVISRMLANGGNYGIVVILWVLIYFFYNYYQKSRKDQIQKKRMQEFLTKKESDFEKSKVDCLLIEESLERIKRLIDINPGQARKAITEFSNLLRTGYLKAED